RHHQHDSGTGRAGPACAAGSGGGYVPLRVAPQGRGRPSVLYGAARGGLTLFWLAPWLTVPALTVKGAEASWPPYGPLRSANILRPDPLTASLGGHGWAPVRATGKPLPRPTGASNPNPPARTTKGTTT